MSKQAPTQCSGCRAPTKGRGGTVIGYPAEGEPKLPHKRVRLCSACWSDIVVLCTPLRGSD